jgi:hypothetical protein
MAETSPLVEFTAINAIPASRNIRRMWLRLGEKNKGKKVVTIILKICPVHVLIFLRSAMFGWI